MGQRSRKRRTTGGTSAASPARRDSPRRGEAGDEPAGRGSGVRRLPAGGDSTAGGAPGAGTNGNRGGARSPSEDNLRRGYARGRAKEEEARANLQPLGPKERPRAVTVAAVIAALLALANLVLLLIGLEVNGEAPSVTGTLIFCAIMAAAAVGMWFRQYWAVLGFEMLLGIALVGAGISLLRASNLQAVALCLGIFVLCGPLFWFLIRAMARLQMPSRTR